MLPTCTGNEASLWEPDLAAAARAVSFGPGSPATPTVERIVLADFRSYGSLDLAVSGRLVVLTGENGAGKTNLLEALSLFSPGRGLRRADGRELARTGGAGGWAASVALRAGPDEPPRQLGTGVDPPSGDGTAPARRCRIDRAPVGSASRFAEHLRVVWLTPSMDGLFAGPAGERRRFLDRVVLTLDPDHSTRVSALERALRNRNRLLEDGRSGRLDRTWLDAAEREVAGLGVAVAAARADVVVRLSALTEAGRQDASPFPWAAVALEGPVEDLLLTRPALDVEERYRAMLRDSRARDGAAGRTTVGPHLSDVAVRHGPKDVPAERCSTGEQKALVVGLVLAQARLAAAASGIAPLMLLDEVAAHFDPRRRAALLGTLAELGGQVFMTGADPAAFADAPQAERFLVEPGRVTPV